MKLVHHYLNRERWALSKVILRRFSDLFLLHITVRPTVSRGSLRPLLGRSQAWRYCGQCSDQSIEAGITACSAKSTSIWHYSRLSMAARRDWYQMWTLFVCLFICLFLHCRPTWGYGPLIACRPSLFMLTLSVSFVPCMLSYSIFWSQTSNKLTYFLACLLSKDVSIYRKRRDISPKSRYPCRIGDISNIGNFRIFCRTLNVNLKTYADC